LNVRSSIQITRGYAWLTPYVKLCLVGISRQTRAKNKTAAIAAVTIMNVRILKRNRRTIGPAKKFPP
jgi:hypothetical protein